MNLKTKLKINVNDSWQYGMTSTCKVIDITDDQVTLRSSTEKHDRIESIDKVLEKLDDGSYFNAFLKCWEDDK